MLVSTHIFRHKFWIIRTLFHVNQSAKINHVNQSAKIKINKKSFMCVFLFYVFSFSMFILGNKYSFYENRENLILETWMKNLNFNPIGLEGPREVLVHYYILMMVCDFRYIIVGLHSCPNKAI